MYLSRFLTKSKVTKMITPLQKAQMVIPHKHRFEKPGASEKDIYFSQQERNVLRKLLLKMESEAEKHTSSSIGSDSDDHHFVPTSERKKKAQAKKVEDSGLRKIFETHGITPDPELLKQLEHWRKN